MLSKTETYHCYCFLRCWAHNWSQQNGEKRQSESANKVTGNIVELEELNVDLHNEDEVVLSYEPYTQFRDSILEDATIFDQDYT